MFCRRSFLVLETMAYELKKWYEACQVGRQGRRRDRQFSVVGALAENTREDI